LAKKRAKAPDETGATRDTEIGPSHENGNNSVHEGIVGQAAISNETSGQAETSNETNAITEPVVNQGDPSVAVAVAVAVPRARKAKARATRSGTARNVSPGLIVPKPRKRGSRRFKSCTECRRAELFCSIDSFEKNGPCTNCAAVFGTCTFTDKFPRKKVKKDGDDNDDDASKKPPPKKPARVSAKSFVISTLVRFDGKGGVKLTQHWSSEVPE
jgi:hypothetical protein